MKKPAPELKVSVDFTLAAPVPREIKVRAEREMLSFSLQHVRELKQALASEETLC